MFALDVAPARNNNTNGGYGSRLALRLAGTTGEFYPITKSQYA